MDDKELIRLRAYEIWIREGQPEGRELEHWLQARREVLGDRADIPEPEREELKQSTELG